MPCGPGGCETIELSEFGFPADCVACDGGGGEWGDQDQPPWRFQAAQIIAR